MNRLRDMVALVIGGSGGIGGEIARGFAAESARIGIAGRTLQKVDAAVNAIRSGGGEAAGMLASSQARRIVERRLTRSSPPSAASTSSSTARA